MSTILFFSWQADRPTKTGRNLIERALERAIGILAIEVDKPVRHLEIDRDTKDVPGTPPIVDTIFAKIDAAAIFLPDLTFVGHRSDGRPTPNPNVLIEYGWALKRHGHKRIIFVMNTAYGAPDANAMPFDLRHLRHPITYFCPEDADADTRRGARDELANKLVPAIRRVVADLEIRESLEASGAPAFCRAISKDGPGRFRDRGRPLGFVEGDRDFVKGSGEIHLASGPPIWLRLFPKTGTGKSWKSRDLRQALGSTTPAYAHSGGWNYLRAEDGVAFYSVRSNHDVTDSLTFLFQTGELWCIDSWQVNSVRDDYLPLQEDEFCGALQRFTEVARRLRLDGPFVWIAGISGVLGRGIAHPNGTEVTGRCVRDTVQSEGNHDYDVDASLSLEPFFEAVFESCGVDRAELSKAYKQRRRTKISYSTPKP